MESSQYGIAAELLGMTSLEALRKEARRNRQWTTIYRGFRADSLTRPLLLRGARAFAANPAQLLRLCNVFLDSIEVPEGKDPAARFAEAANLPDLDEHAKALCSLLATTDLHTLPRFGDPQAEVAPQEAASPTEDGSASSESVGESTDVPATEEPEKKPRARQPRAPRSSPSVSRPRKTPSA